MKLLILLIFLLLLYFILKVTNYNEPFNNLINNNLNFKKKSAYKLTCVSGYWNVKNKHNNKYEEWFSKSLKINCPYVFFSDKETIKKIKKHRGNIPTYYIELNIEDFITYKYKNRMKTHKKHCPSIKLNLIWNEKIFLVKKAFELNPYKSDYFCWVDSGVSIYRNKFPPKKEFPNLEKLNKLPTDKLIYTSSGIYDENKIKKNNYYHYISGTYIIHKNIIKKFVKIYLNYLDKLLDKNNIWTDQVILTHIYKDNKNIFYKIADGYSTIFSSLK